MKRLLSTVKVASGVPSSRSSRVCQTRVCRAFSTGQTQKAQEKGKGDISNLFTSLGAKAKAADPRFGQVKASIAPKKDQLHAGWTSLQQAIENERAVIQKLGSDVVPQVSFKEINDATFPAHIDREIRKRGVVVVRDVIDRETALEYKRDVKEYIKKHKEHITGFPANDPQVFEVYWAPSMVEARQHPNMAALQTALNGMWSSSDSDVDLTQSMTYVDRMRIRKPGDTVFTLEPHIDGGSVERWEDETYRKTYGDLWKGDWKGFDAWDATHRARAATDMYNAPGACSMFRTFQGWLSLSTCAPGNGTLQVVPLLQESIAYVLLRPFLEDVPRELFCGAVPGYQQDITREYHSLLRELVVSIPSVHPGDAVFWHCDLIHSVESKHEGTEDSSVFYIPAAPMCHKNKVYVQQQLETFRKGMTPPDFPPNHNEVEVHDRAAETMLSAVGRKMMGL